MVAQNPQSPALNNRQIETNSPGKDNQSKQHFFQNEKWKPNYSTIASLSALILIVLILGSWVVFMYWQNNQLQRDVLINEEAALFQRRQKDEIRDIWEEQAALNDDLVYIQSQALSEAVSYQTELLKNFRIINGQPQGNPGQDIDKLRQTEDRLYNILSDMDKIIEINAKRKQEYKDRVDQLYKKAEEEQNRRANPRDGVN